MIREVITTTSSCLDVRTENNNSLAKKQITKLTEDVQTKIAEAEKLLAQTNSQKTLPGLNFDFLVQLKKTD